MPAAHCLHMPPDSFLPDNLLLTICVAPRYPPATPRAHTCPQSKLLFTAGLMMGIMQTRLRLSQWGALTMLIAGSLLVQLSEASKSVVAGGNAYLGGMWAILGSLLSSLPNVYYEKLLKEKDTNEWARNIQMTFWIFLWILCSMGFESKVGLDLSGFTANVWLIIALKALNCLLIPATLKYADNILYSYAKPTSIVLTCALSSMVSGGSPLSTVPSCLSRAIARVLCRLAAPWAGSEKRRGLQRMRLRTVVPTCCGRAVRSRAEALCVALCAKAQPVLATLPPADAFSLCHPLLFLGMRFRDAGSLPAPRFVAGMVLVLASIALYNNKPTIKAKEA